MAHNWEFCGEIRTCLNCGKRQNRTVSSYDVMSGTTYLWRPLAGKCEAISQFLLAAARQFGAERFLEDGMYMNKDDQDDITYYYTKEYPEIKDWLKIPEYHRRLLLRVFTNGWNAENKYSKEL